MPDAVLVDNDVVLKTCCYDTVDELLACIGGTRAIHVLGVARYVLQQAIAKRKNIVNKPRAQDRLTSLLARVALLEPTEDELTAAAAFEEAAQSSGLALDVGESQLLAVLLARSAALLVTGDKRAIASIEAIVQSQQERRHARGRVACLEQVVMAIIARHGVEMLHPRVCGEAGVDIALAICFACASGSCDHESITQLLAGYIRDLRQHAPSILVESDDLSTVIP